MTAIRVSKTVYLKLADAERLDALAKRANRSASNLMETIVLDWLKTCSQPLKVRKESGGDHP